MHYCHLWKNSEELDRNIGIPDSALDCQVLRAK